MSHDYQYVREYCEKGEKICTNCGKFLLEQSGQFITGSRQPRGPAIDAPECPGPPRKLKPGVRPHRPYRHGSPSVDVPGVGRIVGRKPDVVPPTSESVPPSKPDVIPPKPAVNQPGARNVNVGGNNTGIINVGDDATIETGDKFPLCDG